MSPSTQPGLLWPYLSFLCLIAGTGMGAMLGWIKATSDIFAGTVYAVALGALIAVVLSGLAQWLILRPNRFKSDGGQWIKLSVGSALGAINTSLAINLLVIGVLVVLWPEWVIPWLSLNMIVGAIGGILGGTITATVLIPQESTDTP